MANLATSVTVENEIVKASDFQFSHDQQLKNIGLAISSLIGGNGRDFVIGGKVLPSGYGMKVDVEGMLVYSGASGRIGIETEVTRGVSLEAADDTYDRIDTVQVAIEETGYDEQSRVFINPDTKVKTPEQINTKKKVVLNITVKRGANDARVAPSPDAGCVKIAEISVPKNTTNIQSSHIKNVSARASGYGTSDWTNDFGKTFSPINLSRLIKAFLECHTESGAHKQIPASALKKGVNYNELNSSLVPIGESMTLNNVAYESTESTKNMVKALVSFCNTFYEYANSVFSRYQYVRYDVVASTVNVALFGEQTIDETEVKANDRVLLTGQTDKRENGLWIVETGEWERVNQNTNWHFIGISKGVNNKGKVFYQPKAVSNIGTDEIDYKTVNFMSEEIIPFSFIIRDINGRAKVAAPLEEDEVAVKATVTAEENARKEYEKQLTGHYDSCDGRNLLTVLGVQDVAQAMAKLHQKCSDGDFSGLMIGDYLDLPSFFGGQRIVISGFNQYYGCGDTENSRHHILWTFKDIITQRAMNSTDTNEGGYPASAMKTFLDGEVATALREALGGDYLYTVRRATSHKGSTGWDSFTVFLPTEVEVFGNSTYGDDLCGWNTCVQFPIFRNSSYYRVKRINGARIWWWLGTPTASSAAWFCNAHNNGYSNYRYASNTDGGVAPAFCTW